MALHPATMMENDFESRDGFSFNKSAMQHQQHQQQQQFQNNDSGIIMGGGNDVMDISMHHKSCQGNITAQDIQRLVLGTPNSREMDNRVHPKIISP